MIFESGEKGNIIRTTEDELRRMIGRIGVKPGMPKLHIIRVDVVKHGQFEQVLEFTDPGGTPKRYSALTASPMGNELRELVRRALAS